MSNKQRQVQYLGKQSRRSDPTAAPPRYQPPPLPPVNGVIDPLLISVAKENKAGRPNGEGADVASQERQAFARRPYPPTVPNLKLYPLSTRQFPVETQPTTVRRHDDENINRLLNRPLVRDGSGDTAQPSQPRRSGHGESDPPRTVSRGEAESRPVETDPSRPGQAEMLKFAKRAESDPVRAERARALADELRVLREANLRLGDDNRELRDLCCFLDDDRQKGRKLAREWQRFGRYTASVMRQEVAAYQSKLRELDNKQQELIRDNLELKELCLYLDEERSGSGACVACGAGGAAALRDDGDGSSSSTNADEPRVPAQFSEGTGPVLQREAFGDRTARYVRSLEGKIQRLEEDKKRLQTELTRGATPGDPERASDRSPAPSGRPEAVVRALQVLEVRERLERDGGLDDNSSADMDDCEKALVREMCDVVWRKMEEGPSDGRR